MHPFQFYRAPNDTGAIEATASGTRFLVGGTTLVDLMREYIEQPTALVDINRLAHLRIEITPHGLEIGALARMSDVAADPAVAATYPVIAESLLASASAQSA
jgi:xanthine dehydrogenase YagS FAD-binding subunit